MPYVHSVHCAFPKHYYDQETLIQGLLNHWSRRYFNPSRIVAFQRNVLVMGWDIVDSGFQVVLSKDVPDIVAHELPGVFQDFLNDIGIEREGLTFFVAHPGGPKVLHTMEQVLQLTRSELQYSWDSLAEHGNMSSVSVLAVLAKTLENLPATGSLGLLLAMGPAFCAELGVVRCQEPEPL